MKLTFVELPAFARHRENYLDDDEFRQLQLTLLAHPDAGDRIPGSGGLRKLRWRARRMGKGTRGGLRVIYFHLEEDHQVWLFTLYGKNEMSDLSRKEKLALKQAIRTELSARRRQL